MKKYVLFLLALSAFLVLAVSCSEDQKEPENAAADLESTVSITTETTQEETETTTGLPKEFYSMTVKEATVRYGNINGSFRTKDGENEYVHLKIGTAVFEGYGDKEWPIYTLGVRTIGSDEEPTAVCEMEGCMHKPDSDCPLAKFSGDNPYALDFVCYSGKLYWFSKYGELFCYDLQSKNSVLLKTCQRSPYLLTPEKEHVYLCDSTEEGVEVYRIETNNSLTLLGQIASSSLIMSICNNRYAIFSELKKSEKEELSIIRYDMQTDKRTTILKLDALHFKNSQMCARLVYGSKLLLSVSYYDDSFNHEKLALFDITTKEQRVLSEYDYMSSEDLQDLKLYAYSEKCIMYTALRASNKEHLILHVYFPYDDREETYDLSEFAGTDLPTDLSIDRFYRGAIDLYYTKKYYFGPYSGKRFLYAYEINLITGEARSIEMEVN